MQNTWHTTYYFNTQKDHEYYDVDIFLVLMYPVKHIAALLNLLVGRQVLPKGRPFYFDLFIKNFNDKFEFMLNKKQNVQGSDTTKDNQTIRSLLHKKIFL